MMDLREWPPYHPLCTKLGKKNVRTTQEILNLDPPYITLEEQLNTHLDNPTSYSVVSSECLSKNSRKQREDTDKGIYSMYDKYTPPNNYLGRIYRECANTEVRKAGFRPPNTVRESANTVRESAHTNKSKHYRFHRGHVHNTDDFIQIKDVIESLIKKDRLSEYVKGEK